MDSGQIYYFAQEAIFTMLWMSGPIMIVALVVGLIVALLQALTSIQEITLTFVPKIVLVFVAILLFAPFMTSRLDAFSQNIFAEIAASGD